MRNAYVELLAACIAVRDEWDQQIEAGDDVDLGSGLCLNTDWRLSANISGIAAHGIRNDLFAAWPKFSGERNYPVPHPNFDSENETLSARDMACDAYDELPMYTGEYGALRRELLDFMIETLTSEIAQCDTN